MDQITICNMALGRVGAKRINSLTEPTVPAQLLHDQWDMARDFCLEQKEWQFALRVVELTRVAEDPIDRWNAAWGIPGDCIKAIAVSETLQFHLENDTPWQLRGREGQGPRRIVTYHTGPLWLKYVSRVIDPCDWSASFKQALVAYLAWQVAMPLPRSAKIADREERNFWNIVGLAGVLDGQQGRAPRQEGMRRLITVR